MKILFDLQALQPDIYGSSFHGGGEYARVYLEKIIEIKIHARHIFECIYDGSRALDINISNLCRNNKIRIIDIKQIVSLKEFIDLNEYDTFYSALPYKNYSDLKLKKCRFIFTLHGLRALEMPYDLYEYKFQNTLKKYLIIILKVIFPGRYRQAKKNEIKKLLAIKNKILITDSYHSKYSIINYFPKMEENQIKVIYAPIKNKPGKFPTKKEKAILRKHELVCKKYFLIVSANRWIKNPYRAVRAFDELFSDKELDYKVLVLGATNKKIFKTRNKDKFIFDGYVDQEELEILYKNAFAFFFPSLNEGFGLPPVEAMKYGTPVISSAISSTMEICRDNVLYFNPFSIDEMKNRILYLCHDSNKYNELSDKGLKRYKELIYDQKKSLPNDIKIILGIDKKSV